MANFRLIETFTQYTTEHEDGPGSLPITVEDTQESVYHTWENRSEEFGQKILTEGLSGLNGFEGDREYSYRLEVLGGNGTWKNLGIVPIGEEDPPSENLLRWVFCFIRLSKIKN
jgi:hypothetical protein